MGRESGAAIRTSHWEMLHAVFGVWCSSASFSIRGGKLCPRTTALAVVICFTRCQFWTSKSSGIASSGTSRSILAGHPRRVRLLAPQEELADAWSGHGRACGAPGSAASINSTPRSSSRGRGDQLPSGAQPFFSIRFDRHLAGKRESI